MKEIARFPLKVRVSSGSAILLGLMKARLDVAPTTIYLMTYRKGKCTANCGFCPQARQSKSKSDMLSRVTWPIHTTQCVLAGIYAKFRGRKIERVCIQALNYPKVFIHLRALVRAIHERTSVPISVSCQPTDRESIVQLSEAGVERIGIPLDGATEEIFTRVKGSLVGGPYSWRRQRRRLEEAVSIFGKMKVSTHLIVGLGETEKEMVNTIQECARKAVLPGLFAFTPIPGTELATVPAPSLERYRRIQLARYLIVNGLSCYEDMSFSQEGTLINFGLEKRMLTRVIETGEAFLTSGCLGCNRPYYNEKPSGPVYNFPRKLARKEVAEIERQLQCFTDDL